MNSVVKTQFFVAIFLFISVIGFAQQKKKIGYLMDDFNAGRWRYDSAFFAQKVRALGHEPLIRVCDSDTVLQLQQAKDLIKAGVSVLVVVPENSLAARAIVKAAHEKDVPVIAYDRLILDCPLDYYVSFNGERVGELQAEYVLKTIGYKGDVMIMNGPERDINSLLLKKGQMNVLQPYIKKGDVKIVYDKFLSEWTSMEAFMESNNFLSGYKGKVNGVIAANDDIAQGFLEAAEIYLSGENIALTGQDASVGAYENIMKGAQGMTVFKSLMEMGSGAAELACTLAEGKPFEVFKTTSYNGKINVPTLQLEPVTITKENIEQLRKEYKLMNVKY
jgi:D-xylose transport system substrate-binding protein